MPRFNEQEKARIEEDLLKKGKNLFSIYGLKKTSIDDIVQACGIGKGTFYRFFNSKEELFFAIAEREEAFRDELVKEMMKSSKPPKESFKEFLLECLKFIESNPFLRRLNDQQELEMLYRKLPKETVERHFKNDLQASLIFIDKWQEEGKIIKEDPEVFVGIFQVLFIIITLREEIGDSIYPRVIEKYIDFIVDGMFV